MNHEFQDLDAFAAFLSEKSEQIIGTLNETAGVSARLLGEHAHNLFGQHPPLAELAEATKAERRAIEGISEDEPLFRTGELLRNALEVKKTTVRRRGTADVAEAGVGSAEIINLYHETGYVNARTGRSVPPRPVFRITATELGEPLADLFSGEIRRVMAS